MYWWWTHLKIKCDLEKQYISFIMCIVTKWRKTIEFLWKSAPSTFFALKPLRKVYLIQIEGFTFLRQSTVCQVELFFVYEFSFLVLPNSFQHSNLKCSHHHPIWQFSSVKLIKATHCELLSFIALSKCKGRQTNRDCL